MSLLKEGIKRLTPLLALGIIVAGCNNNDTYANLVDCKNGPKSNSTTLFLKNNGNMTVDWLDITATNPGVLQIKAPDNIIKIIPDKETEIDTRGQHISIVGGDPTPEIMIYSKSRTFTISGKASSKENIQGTEVTVQTNCRDKK